MIVKREALEIELADYDLEHGFPCPVCGKPFIPNGTGPTNLGPVASILQGTPGELVCGGVPARFHDSAYLLCPLGWKVIYRRSGVSYIAESRPTADDQYRRLMLDEHKDAKGLARWLLRFLAERNYWAVRAGGGVSYAHRH